MFLKTISSKALIAQVYRDFRPTNSSWVEDAIEWIGQGLGIIGHGVGYERKAFEIHIEDYRAKIPFSVDDIESVSHRGHDVPYNSAISSIDHGRVKDSTSEWYTLNPNYIQTSFQRGTIKIYADVPPVDEDCYPMIPDEAFHKEALAWWIMTKMLGRGHKHPIFDYKDAFNKWQYYYPQATNAGNFPNIDQMEEFTRRWTAMIPLYNMGVRFHDIGKNITIDGDEAIQPKDNIRTIIHVTP